MVLLVGMLGIGVIRQLKLHLFLHACDVCLKGMGCHCPVAIIILMLLTAPHPMGAPSIIANGGKLYTAIFPLYNASAAQFIETPRKTMIHIVYYTKHRESKL